MKNVFLQKAAIEDIDALLSLEKSVSGKNIYSQMLEKNEWLEELQKSTVYLIKNGGIVVGSISYEIKNDDHAYISGLVIDPHFQNQGIAKEALSKVLEELRETKRIDLVTHPDNVAALKLYKSFGFIVESRKEDYYGDGEPRLVLSLLK